MSQYKSQIQNLFLSQARKRHQKAEVVLETGTVLRGKIKAYDQFSISLSFKDKVEIIYKSSIIYISLLPMRPEPVRRFSNSAPRRYDRDSSPAPRPSYPKVFVDDDVEINDPPPPKKPRKDDF